MRILEKLGLPGRGGGERPRGARGLRADALRRGADGRADAGHGRLRGHAADPRARARGGRAAAADRRHDRERDEGRPREVPRGGHGRLRLEAGHAGGARGRAAALGGRAPRRRPRRPRPPPPRRGGLLDEAIVASLMSVDDDGSADGRGGRHLPQHRARPARRDPQGGREGNAAQLERAAHSFLGSCGNLGCRRMADLCARLEVLGRSGSTEGAPDARARPRGGVRRGQAPPRGPARRATRSARAPAPPSAS